MHILVVDDYPDNCISWALLLRLLGFSVDTATDGFRALELARATRPDVGILDMTMPRIDGCELARRLRALYPDRLVLIALTARDSDEDRRQVREAGFNLHLVKPADPIRVTALLKEAWKLLGRGA
jgi:CheY-like chemotaxis protein